VSFIAIVMHFCDQVDFDVFGIAGVGFFAGSLHFLSPKQSEISVILL